MAKTRGGFKRGSRSSERLRRFKVSNLPNTTEENPVQVDDERTDTDEEAQQQQQQQQELSESEEQIQHDDDKNEEEHDDDFVNPPPNPKPNQPPNPPPQPMSGSSGTKRRRYKTRAKRQLTESPKEETLADLFKSKKSGKGKRTLADMFKPKKSGKGKTSKQERKLKQTVDEDDEEDIQQEKSKRKKKKADKVPKQAPKTSKRKRKLKQTVDEDDEEEIQEEKSKRKKNEADIDDSPVLVLSIRNSPSLFSKMVEKLSTAQHEWVKKSAFAALLDFKLDKLPAGLAGRVLHAFNHITCSLKLPTGEINITAEDVEDVLGLPCKGHPIKVGNQEVRIANWMTQFPNKSQFLIRADEVIEKIENEQDVNENFKMNFLMVLTNIFIESNTNTYLNRKMLYFDDNLDNSNNYNWSNYLLRSLKVAKGNWLATKSRFFTGPIIFLTLLYVDRIINNGERIVTRQKPTFKGWTNLNLKQRQEEEMIPGAFGTGEIMIPARIEFQEEHSERHQKEADEENQTTNSNLQQHQEVDNETDWYSQLTEKAGMLLDAKEQYQIALTRAKNNKEDNEDVAQIEASINDAFRKLINDVSSSETTPKADHVSKGKQKQVVEIERDYNVDENDLDILCAIEWLHSSQGRKVMDIDMDTFSAPSFDLGIDFDDQIKDICQEINMQNEESNEFKTPKQQDQPREKRNKQIAPAFKSPFLERTIDINGRYSKEQFCVWKWVTEPSDNPLEEVFRNGDLISLRDHMASFKFDEDIYYSVIDLWASILNESENLKSPESPMRLFVTTSTLAGVFSGPKEENERYRIFSTNMNHFMITSNRKMDGIDLVFFPICVYEHYYLLCFNIKNPAIDIIDNIKREKDETAVAYGDKIVTLRNLFVKYLETLNMNTTANNIRNLLPNHLKMPWQTTDSNKDCAIFLMRHMETYKGDKKDWQTGLKKERNGQKYQLQKLRLKYCHAILTSTYNQKKDVILEKAKDVYNKVAQQTLLKVVLDASSKKNKKPSRNGKNKKIQKC